MLKESNDDEGQYASLELQFDAAPKFEIVTNEPPVQKPEFDGVFHHKHAVDQLEQSGSQQKRQTNIVIELEEQSRELEKTIDNYAQSVENVPTHEDHLETIEEFKKPMTADFQLDLLAPNMTLADHEKVVF